MNDRTDDNNLQADSEIRAANAAGGYGGNAEENSVTAKANEPAEHIKPESSTEQPEAGPQEDESKTISFTPIKKPRLDEEVYLEDTNSAQQPPASKKRAKKRRSAPRTSTIVFWCIAALALAATAGMYFWYDSALDELSRIQAEYEQTETQMRERSERNRQIEDELAQLNEQIESLDSQLQ